MKKKTLLLTVFIFLFVSCRLNIAPQYHAEDTNGKIHIIVNYFDLDKAHSNYQGNIDFQKRISEYIAGNLQSKNIAAVAISPNKSSNNVAYIIQGEIYSMDTGIWAVRFFLGGGFRGAGYFAVKAKLIDVANGSVIDEFDDSRQCGTWNGDDGILDCGCIEISHDIVDKFLPKLK
jgi:hypothetical protein